MGTVALLLHIITILSLSSVNSSSRLTNQGGCDNNSDTCSNIIQLLKLLRTEQEKWLKKTGQTNIRHMTSQNELLKIMALCVEKHCWSNSELCMPVCHSYDK